MSVTTENAPVQGQTTLQENRAGEGVYASLFEKLISPRRLASGISTTFWTMPRSRGAGGGTSHRGDAGVYGTHPSVRPAGGKLDKTLIDHHIAELDFQISRQLDAVMHHQEFQQVESLWRGLKQLVDNTDYRQNVKTEILDVAKDDLRRTLRTRRSLSRAACTGTPIPRSMTLPAASRSAR